MLVHPPKARPGDRVAVVSPAFAAPAVGPAIHEQAMRRLVDLTGLEPVEYPTTRRLGATAEDRAADLNAAFADPTIRAIVATIGGDDQITVIPHLDAELIRRDPKPFVGYSDNTNLHDWLWRQGVASFYGGSTQVQLGSGPRVDPEQASSLRASLLDGGVLELTEPGESQDFGLDWGDPRALTDGGERRATEPWTWAGPATSVTGATWGGCLEAIQWILTAGRGPAEPSALDGGMLLVETSEELIPALEVGRILRSLGERGLLGAVKGVLVARPPASNFDVLPTAGRAGRASRAAARRRDRGDRALQPRCRGLRGGAVRAHPPAMDRAARRRGHARRRIAAGLGRLPLRPGRRPSGCPGARVPRDDRRPQSHPEPRTPGRCRRNERFRILKHRNGLVWCESRIAAHTLIDMLQ